MEKEESNDQESDVGDEASRFRFPDLFRLFQNMIKVIYSSKSNALLKNYRRFIDGRLEKGQLPELLRGCIDFQVASLQGQRLNAKSLQKVEASQSPREYSFSGLGGYLNFFANDRDPENYKIDVGQSVNILRGISRHALSSSRGDKSSLH